MQKAPVLKHLDAPIRFLSFTAVELTTYISPFFIGAIVDSVFIVPVLGFFLIFGFKRWMKRYPKFSAIRFLYWSLPTQRFNRLLGMQWPPSHIRFWVK